MKRLLTLLVCASLVLVCGVVPSFAASSTPSYPSGTSHGFFNGTSPSNNPTSSASNFYVAVSAGLTNGFKMISKGLYTLQTNTNNINTALTGLRNSLFGSRTGYTVMGGIGTGYTTNSYTTTTGALDAINSNTYYGFQSLYKGIDVLRTSISAVDGHITTMDGHLTSGFTSLGGKLDTNFTSLKQNLDGNFSELLKALLGTDMNFDFQVDLSKVEGGLDQLNGTVSGGFPMINTWFQVFYNLLFDPLDEELKEETSDQKQELLDHFYGDGSQGVQGGQIGSLGEISSSAGSLLDTGGNIGNVFSEIGNSGSSIWSWFSSENSNAINGSGGLSLASDDDLVSPSPEIIDFYTAQREELFSMLGGGG